MKHLFTGLTVLATSLTALAQPDCSQIIQASFTATVQGNIVVVTNTSVSQFPQATTYQWYFGDGGTSDGNIVTHVYDAPGTYLLCLYAIVENCVDTVCQEVQVGGENPCDNLTAEFAYATTGSIVQFNNALSSNQYSYLWYFGDGTQGYGADPEHTYPGPGTYSTCLVMWSWNPFTQDTCWADNCETVMIQGDEDPCEGLQAGFFANVQPGAVQFSNATTGTGFQTTWNWSFGDGSTSTDAQPLHVYDQPGGYLVCLTAISIYEQSGGGVITCVDSICQEVTAPGEGSPCDGLNADFNVSVQGSMAMLDNTVSSNEYSYVWDFGDGTEGYGPDPMHTYSGPGTYQICLLMWGWDPFTQDTCFADHCEWITIGQSNPCDSLFACFQWGLQNSTAQFYNCSGPDGQGLSYWWSFGDGTNGDGYQPAHTYPGPGTYVVCLTVFADNSPDSCSNTICNTLVIQGGGSPCDSLTADFVVTSQENIAAFSAFGGNAIGYQWNFGDGTSGDGPAPIHTYPGPGTYQACLITWTWNPFTQDTCYADHCEWITIGGGDPCDGLQAGFFANASPNGVQFSNGTTGTGFSTTWSWTFGDGTSSNDAQPFHEYPEPGNYLVCLTAISIYEQNGGGLITCVDSVCQEVEIPGEGSPCEDLNAAFNPVAGGLSVNIQNAQVEPGWSYAWDFGDGTIGDGPGPFHVYDQPGEYLICLIVGTYDPIEQDSCFADNCVWITIGGGDPCDGLQAGFQASVGDATVWFSNTTVGTGYQTTWYWDFGDGTTSDDAQPSHIFPDLGTYEVCLTVSTLFEQQGGGVITCQDEYCGLVVTGGGSPCDSLSAYFVFTTQENLAAFTTFGGAAIGYQWSFGDGTSGDGPAQTHIYPGPGTYHACLVTWAWNPFTQDTCFADHCEWITIGGGDACDGLQAGFQANVGDATVWFSNTTIGTGFQTTWYWDFGDGTTSDDAQPSHIFPDLGTYEVCLTVSTLFEQQGGGVITCQDEYCGLVVTGGGSPCDSTYEASFQWSAQGNGTVSFFGFTTPASTGYHWNFGDGTQGDGMNPLHAYAEPGEYHVCLSAWYWNQGTQDTCWAEHCQWIFVSGETPCDSLEAHFVWEPGGPNVFLFQDASFTNGQDVSYFWSFGDGQYNDDGSPAHTFTEPGQYQVCLTVTVLNSPDSCSSTTCQIITVQGAGSPCEGLNAEFSATVTGYTAAVQAGFNPPGTTFEWLFGDGTSGEGSNNTHTYPGPGTYNLCLIVGNYDPVAQDSCFEDHCLLITLEPGGSACDSLWTASFEFGHQGNVYTFYNTSDTQGAEVSTQWAFGDGTFGDGSQLVHTYTTSGVYTVCMTITGTIPGTDDSCQVEICHTIEVSVGIDDLAVFQPINAWPQPFDNVLQLEGAVLQGNTRYTLLDMTGRIVDDRSTLSHGRMTLEYADLPAGAYVLRLRNAILDRSLRVVKR